MRHKPCPATSCLQTTSEPFEEDCGNSLQIPLEDVQDPAHKLLDILHTIGPNKIMLPINETTLETTKMAWHTPATCTSLPKRVEKKYFAPYQGAEHLFFHLNLNSLLDQIVTEHNRLHQLRPILQTKMPRDQIFVRFFSSVMLFSNIELPCINIHV